MRNLIAIAVLVVVVEVSFAVAKSANN